MKDGFRRNPFLIFHSGYKRLREKRFPFLVNIECSWGRVGYEV
ncbi:hypothetical protein ALIPUT_01546 [Alistipes putredinis DSM 17216]|uniref:Uncharacterized protein n=1 Tax=Alistipes putredinis DSM 17216 TaxID=445970 RepID=B0MWL2_9BACT|nr:hypothetical protein ALIPUT_01546 [Alistipes putredinis DSM 17216]